MSARRQSFPVVYGLYTVLMTMLLSGWTVAAYAKKKNPDREPSYGEHSPSLCVVGIGWLWLNRIVCTRRELSVYDIA